MTQVWRYITRVEPPKETTRPGDFLHHVELIGPERLPRTVTDADVLERLQAIEGWGDDAADEYWKAKIDEAIIDA